MQVIRARRHTILWCFRGFKKKSEWMKKIMFFLLIYNNNKYNNWCCYSSSNGEYLFHLVVALWDDNIQTALHGRKKKQQKNRNKKKILKRTFEIVKIICKFSMAILSRTGNVFHFFRLAFHLKSEWCSHDRVEHYYVRKVGAIDISNHLVFEIDVSQENNLNFVYFDSIIIHCH